MSRKEKKILRHQHEQELKLKHVREKQDKFLDKLHQVDSLPIAPSQRKKLEKYTKQVKGLEDELAVTKINKEKLLADFSKYAKADPYLKEYAKYKRTRKLENFESAEKLTNSTVLKNMEVDAGSKEATKLKGLKTDSASVVTQKKALGLAELNKQKEVKELRKELRPYLNSPYLKGYTLKDLDSLSVDSLKYIAKETFNNLDKVLEKELTKRAEMIAFKSDMANMKEFKDLPEGYKSQFEQYTDKEYLQTEGMSRAVKEASKYLAEHQDKLADAQTQLTKLKKKYSSVPNSNDLSTATKRNSLKGKSFKERVVIGGNLQLVSTVPLIIDASPMIGYKIDKQSVIGFGATYRTRLTEYPKNSRVNLRTSKDELTYGYRAFSEYTIWKGFYVHGEYECMSKEFDITTKTSIGTTTPPDQYNRKWVEAAMLGVGRSSSINGKVKGSVSLLYNFIYNNTEKIYPSPWVFRFGFELK